MSAAVILSIKSRPPKPAMATLLKHATARYNSLTVFFWGCL
jgi:hypothetical protein